MAVFPQREMAAVCCLDASLPGNVSAEFIKLNGTKGS